MTAPNIPIVCLGPVGSGKTLLLKKIRDAESVDHTSCTISTVGTNLTSLKLQNPRTMVTKEYVIRELGGSMAPIWNKFYEDITKVIFVVDASNLCQIAAAGVLLYGNLVHPKSQSAKILIVLTKMDLSYRQMRNEALLMLQMKRLISEVTQQVTLVEASAVTGEGIDSIIKWLQGIPLQKDAVLNPK